MSQTELLALRPVRVQRERLAERDWRAAQADAAQQRQRIEADAKALVAERLAHQRAQAAVRGGSLTSLREVLQREETVRAALCLLQQREAQLAERRERLAAQERDCEAARLRLVAQRRALERLDVLAEEWSEVPS